MLVLTPVVMLAFLGCGGSGRPESSGGPETFENPVYKGNFPDPFVLRVGDTYYAYSTNDETSNVPLLRSDDLVRWRRGRDAMPELAPWVSPGYTWAPEVLLRDDGKYVLYYTAASTAHQVQCIGHAISDSPEGPFVDTNREPFICQANEGGSIDASPFVDDDGSLYLYWKNDGNAVGLDTYIYARRLSPEGLKLVGKPERLVTQDAGWEGDLVEAPLMWKRDGDYYLFFSANAYDSENYAVGYATCEGPLGPCRDAPENPILKTANGAAGPGHNAIIETDGGQTWTLYHAWPPDAVGFVPPGRLLWMDQLVWKDGKPTIKGPTSGPQPVPR